MSADLARTLGRLAERVVKMEPRRAQQALLDEIVLALREGEKQLLSESGRVGVLRAAQWRIGHEMDLRFAKAKGMAEVARKALERTTQDSTVASASSLPSQEAQAVLGAATSQDDRLRTIWRLELRSFLQEVDDYLAQPHTQYHSRAVDLLARCRDGLRRNQALLETAVGEGAADPPQGALVAARPGEAGE